MRRLEITYHYILKSRRTPLPHGVVMGIFQHKVCLVVEHGKRFLFGTMSFFRKPDSLPPINFNEESMIWGATSKCDFALDWWLRLNQVCFTFIVHNMKVVYFLSCKVEGVPILNQKDLLETIECRYWWDFIMIDLTMPSKWSLFCPRCKILFSQV